MQQCAALYDKLEIIEPPNKYDWPENGVKVRFRFSGINEDPGQF